jgi:hypothetical protein
MFSCITEGDNAISERAPLERLANEAQLDTYKHYSLWQLVERLERIRKSFIFCDRVA